MLQATVRTICDAAGWKVPAADAGGRYSFSLEDGLDFSLSSPDGDRLFACAVLLTPETGREFPSEVIARVLGATAARFAGLRAVPALDPQTGALVLYCFTALKRQTGYLLGHFMENFLNDLAFWKAQPWLTVK
jgi:hypothetical protein